ncbi:MAG: ATP-binding protein [Anaerolineales bacterium]
MKWKTLMQVESSDPEDSRRRNLLNILLVGVFGGGVIGLLIVGYGIATRIWTFAAALFLIVVCLGFIAGSLIIFFINRRWGHVAIYAFLALLIIGYIFSDTPANISNGSTVFFYAIPIVIASLLIRPAASFIVAAIGCGIIVLANNAAATNTNPNPVVMIGFFMLGLISWLTARSLENALLNLRKINANLDRLVQERTLDLADSLSRERIEAGRSKAILESIADGVIVFDITGKAIIANPASVQLLQTAYDEIVGATINSLSQSKFLDAHNRTILMGLLTSPTAELTSHHMDWDKKTLSVTSAPVNDTQGMHIGTVAVFRDYTREAEVDRMKNTFLAVVSHELRTPLNAILGYAEMIKEAIYGTVNEKQVQVSDRIMTNTRRLLDIVSDLLDQAQMEAGKLSLRIQPFRPADLIENVHDVMDKIASDKGLELTSELDPTLPEFINGDIARLQQILVNLINNAVKFTETGSVHASLGYAGPESWTILVKDTGIGIPENELSTIFEAFRQVDSTITRKYGGFGLGLTIVKQLAELMGGKIEVTSALGAGSSFLITLPLKQPELKQPERSVT